MLRMASSSENVGVSMPILHYIDLGIHSKRFNELVEGLGAVGKWYAAQHVEVWEIMDGHDWLVGHFWPLSAS